MTDTETDAFDSFPVYPILKRAIVPAIAGILLIVLGTFLFLINGETPLDFALRQKVTAASNLHFSFPASMNHASTEEAIAIPEGITGTWSWDGDILVFDPSANLRAGESYSFVMSPDAKKRDGDPLGKELEFVFVVAGPPRVSAFMPQDAGTVR